MAKEPNLKINVTADTSQFSRGMRESKEAVKNFESTSSGALSKIGSLFGINVGEVNKLASATAGLGIKMSESGKTGVASLGKLIASSGQLATAIAGIGVGALAAGFKLLSDEAENFKNTVDGAMISMKTDAFSSVYSQSMHDSIQEAGKWSAEEASKVEKGWKRAWSNIKTAAVMTMGDISKNGFTNTFWSFGKNMMSVNDVSADATAKAEQAEALTGRLYELQRQLSDKSVEWAKTEAQIAEYKRIAYDKTEDVAVQQQAILKTEELIKSRFGEELNIRNQIADIVSAINDLSSSSPEDIDRANQLRREALAQSVAMNNALRELSERSMSIAMAAKTEAEARKKANDEAKRAKELADRQATAIAKSSALSGGGNALLPHTLDVPESGGIVVPVHVDASPAVAEFSNLADMMVAGVEVMSDAFGNLVSDVISGGNVWENFGSNALKGLASIAVQVGKLAVATGAAALGIKAALKLSPWAAIAAGGALIALGTAVSAGLNNIASGAGGGYSPNTAVANSSFATGDRSGGYGRQSMEVEVVGTLQAKGSTLVAVLKNENKRTEHTT